MDDAKKPEQYFIEDRDRDSSKLGDEGEDTEAYTYENAHQPVGRNRRHLLSAEERQAELAAAQRIDPGISPWSFVGFQFAMIVLVVCLVGSDNGMDGTVMSAINGMEQFQKYFGLIGKAPSTGIVFGIYTCGSVSAALPAAIIPDMFGRRVPMLVGNAILIMGALVTANAKSMHMLLAGRYFTGLGCAFAATAGKSYMAEITSPTNRGKCMGLLNSFYYVGQIIASGIAVPMGRDMSNWSWRVPLFIQVVPAFFNAAAVMFLPESPRYLYAKGKRDEAVRILAKYHSSTNDINSPLIQIEIAEIEEAIDVENGAHTRWWDVRQLFNSGPARYRSALCFMMSVCGQLSGNGLITYFLTILLRQAGITNQNRILTLNFVNSITSFAGALTGTAIVDRVGRRKLMLFGETCCVAGMAIVGGLLSPAGKQSSKRATAGISFIYLFMVFFSLGFTPLQGLYPTELLSFENRAKGLALQGLATSGVSLINTFALPSALKAITYRVYIIFACFDFFLLGIIYFFAVETKQLTLEEIDDVFESGRAVKHSLELAKVHKERRKAAARSKAEQV